MVAVVADSKPTWLDLESRIPLRSKRKRSAETVTGLSADHLKLHYKKYVTKSGAQTGMQLKHALQIARGEA